MKNPDRITHAITNSITYYFAEPEFDDDDGEVRFLGRDENQVRLGLFPFDEDGNPGNTPTFTWTIEVTGEKEKHETS